MRPILCCLGLTLISVQSSWAQHQDSRPGKQSPAQLMQGEEVLPANRAPLISPLARFEEHPWFEISNLRPGRNLSVAMEFDFACTGELKGSFHAVVLTAGRRLRFPISKNLLSERRGTVSCSYNSISDKSPLGADIEVYIELTDADPPSYSRSRYSSAPKPVNPLFFKVSKSATRGNVQARTFSREIRADELKIYAARQKKYGPPPPAPDGFQVCKQHWPIVPGVPALAAYQGDWYNVEILSVLADGKLVAKFQADKPGPVRAMERNAVALDSKVLQRLADNPSSFSPSVRLPRGSTQLPPEGYGIVEAHITLPPGTPVRKGSWEYLVVGDSGASLELISKTSKQVSWAGKDELLILQSLLPLLEAETQQRQFAESLAAVQESVRIKQKASALKARYYEVKAPYPPGFIAVTADTPVEVGDKLQAFWGSQWYPVTVVTLSEAGPIEVHWDTFSGSQYYLVRESMAIPSALAESRKLQKKQEPSASKKTASTESASKTYALILDKLGENRTEVVKLVIDLTETDLALAADAVKSLPIKLKKGLAKEKADEWLQRFKQAGASASLVAEE